MKALLPLGRMNWNLYSRPRRETVRTVFQDLDGGPDALGGLGMHARPAIEDAIDRRKADPGGPGNVLQCRPGHDLPPSPFDIARRDGMQLTSHGGGASAARTGARKRPLIQ
jgi:hypothetical protein